ncbi:hypothetical protein KFE25_011503 [Diacronema lutheri]|uniref:Uncharacterized protein n=1 Tax=Diacronema lutheri TaxID=2081491 RepID=A0A8J6CC12_DIALT|nr:hypothetical protein KFE25_011503 [Diacronema lutheri]
MCCACIDYGSSALPITFSLAIDVPINEFRRTLRITWTARIAAALGVSPSRCSIVGISAGSTTITTEVTALSVNEKNTLVSTIASTSKETIAANWFAGTITVLGAATLLQSPPPSPPPKAAGKRSAGDDDDDGGDGILKGLPTLAPSVGLSQAGIVGVSVASAFVGTGLIAGGAYLAYSRGACSKAHADLYT